MSKVTIYSPPSAAQVKNCTADFDLRRAPVPINLVQFDKTIPVLAVALYKGGTAYKLPEDAEVNVRMSKRNNLYVYNPVLGCNEGRTLVYVAVTPQMTTQDGVFCPILEVLAGGGVAGTSPLQLVIQRNPIQEGDLEDTSEAQTLADLVSQATASANAAANSAAAAKSSEDAAAKSADAAAASAKAAASAVGAAFYGVDFSGSTSAGTRTGAAADFVFTPGTDTSAGQNDFDGVYPWAGMRRCCCTLDADGTVTVNAYKGQPGYIEDGSNGEVLVEVPLFYVSGMLDVNPRVSAVPMPGFRAPKKFQNADGSLKQKCYLPAFPGSIGADGKLHSIAGVVSTGNKNISQFLAAARLWGETYCINTSADFEVLAYLMIVVYGTRNVQSKIKGCESLYATNIAITGARTGESAVTVAKGVLEVGNVISIGTASENESVANRRIVTAIEAIEGDTANVKASFDGEAVTTTTDHKIWRIMQSTGTANSVLSTCGSPVSNTDGKHSFVFYGVENPLYGNQWRMECDWKIVDGLPYICNDTNYNWSSVENYTKLDSLALPNEGWAKNLQADERFPWLQITKEVGGSSGTYLADYFYINKSGTRIVLRGASSSSGANVGAFYIAVAYDASWIKWHSSADLSVNG